MLVACNMLLATLHTTILTTMSNKLIICFQTAPTTTNRYVLDSFCCCCCCQRSHCQPQRLPTANRRPPQLICYYDVYSCSGCCTCCCCWHSQKCQQHLTSSQSFNRLLFSVSSLAAGRDTTGGAHILDAPPNWEKRERAQRQFVGKYNSCSCSQCQYCTSCCCCLLCTPPASNIGLLIFHAWN